MKLYLIRHGQTDWNVAGKIQGKTDIPLNETGKRQAACLARGMEKRPVVQIYSSSLKRALETAQIIGDSQKVNVNPMKELEEVGFGKWEGRTNEEIKRQFPREFQIWWDDPLALAPPGGETREQIRTRCRQAAKIILSQATGDLAVVSHGATLAYLIEYFMRDHPMREGIIVGNSSITTIEFDPFTGRTQMIQQNDSSHLKEMTLQEP